MKKLLEVGAHDGRTTQAAIHELSIFQKTGFLAGFCGASVSRAV